MKKKLLILCLLLLIVTGCKDKNSIEDDKEYTTVLKDQILKDNQVLNGYDLSTTSEESEQNGLYSTSDTNGGRVTYFFRGNVDNYVMFLGLKWRIVRINEDGSIRIILDTGLNSSTGYNYNSDGTDYTKMYFDESEIQKELNKWYNENLKKFDEYIVEEPYCTEFKVVDAVEEQINGSGAVYQGYTPSLRCGESSNLKIGLLSMDEASFAGSFYRKKTNSYLINGNKYWTLSPAGNDEVFSTTYVWIVDTEGQINIYDIEDGVDYNVSIRPVINLKSDTIIKSGRGTFNLPYIVYVK